MRLGPRRAAAPAPAQQAPHHKGGAVAGDDDDDGEDVVRVDLRRAAEAALGAQPPAKRARPASPAVAAQGESKLSRKPTEVIEVDDEPSAPQGGVKVGTGLSRAWTHGAR